MGVTEQEAMPAPSVVAEQPWPARAKVTGTPLTLAIGEAEISTRLAVSVTGRFRVPPAGVMFRLKDVLCLPAVQFTVAKLELTGEPFKLAEALSWSVPVETPM